MQVVLHERVNDYLFHIQNKFLLPNVVGYCLFRLKPPTIQHSQQEKKIHLISLNIRLALQKTVKKCALGWELFTFEEAYIFILISSCAQTSDKNELWVTYRQSTPSPCRAFQFVNCKACEMFAEEATLRFCDQLILSFVFWSL